MKNIYVIALAAILFQGCGQKKEMTAPATRPVKTTIVESRSVIRKDFSGIVEAVEYVKLAFRAWSSSTTPSCVVPPADRSSACLLSKERK